MGVILAFPPGGRRPSRPIGGDEPRGVLLFFTGVRFERHADGETPAMLPTHDVPGGRRRKA